MHLSNFRRYTHFLQIFLIFTLFSSYTWAQGIMRPDPEIATGNEVKIASIGEKFMIVTANPHATKAGYNILEKGGSAVDAAIAAQLVLGLTEPQSSGLGGGAFVLHYDAATKKLSTYDARETAPALAGPFLFYENGKPMGFRGGVLGGRSVGVPGVPMLLEDLHQLYGSLTWMELFDEPIALAKDGFKVSARLAKTIAAFQDDLSKFPDTASYFLDAKGNPLSEGWTLVNSGYENTLREYQFYGASRFYQGDIAHNIIKTVQNIEDNPGLLTLNDFYAYEVKSRDPVCGPYRTYIVCGMGEPSSGGLTLLQILGMVERFDLPEWGVESPKSWHVIAQASRLAFADRGRYMADPGFANTPGIALLDPSYIKMRSALIKDHAALETVEPGVPPLWDGPLYEDGENFDKPGTSHVSVVDAQGNIVSMTTTIESAFGSHVMVDGFLLNNQLTDFSFSPFDKQSALVANMVEPGKRPRSSMAPTIVFDADGKPVFVIGSAGGSNIIGYVAQRIIAVLDWGIDVQTALNMPNILARTGGVEMESEDTDLQNELESLGNTVKIMEKNSGLTAIHIDRDSLISAADPRREGVGLGR